MKQRDSLGRHRLHTQNQGLRPIFPRLPNEHESRLLRIAMPHTSWQHLDQLVAQLTVPTRPRAYGKVIEHLLEGRTTIRDVPAALTTADRTEPFVVALPPCIEDWQVWQIQKEKGLLAEASQRQYH